MAPSISSVPFPPAFVFFFFFGKLQIPHGGDKRFIRKKKTLRNFKMCTNYALLYWRGKEYVFLKESQIWSAICFKIMTRYTCGFFPRILAIIPATRYTCVFLSRILAFFPALWVQTRIYMRTKRPIYMRYKQAFGICGHRKSSYRRHRIIPSAKNPFMYDPDER